MRIDSRLVNAALFFLALPAVAFLPSAGLLSAQSSCTPSPTGTAYTSSTAIATALGASNGTTVAASPYPGTITVPDTVTGTITEVQVELDDVSVTEKNSGGEALFAAEALLVSPNGTEFNIMGGPGNSTENITGVNIFISDTNSYPAMPTTSGTFPGSGTACYESSSYISQEGGTINVTSNPNAYPYPSPVLNDSIVYPQTDGSSTLASAFNGGQASGTWKLYVTDSYGDAVTVNGWKLYLTVAASPNANTTTSVSASLNPSYTSGADSSVTFTATVSSDGGSPTGTVAFSANGSPISCSGGNQVVSGGQATCITTLTTQGITGIEAAYTPGSGFNSSNGSLNQLVEAHPTNPQANEWCNTASLSMPIDMNAVAYPSVIPVSGYNTGTTVSNVEVSLSGLSGAANSGVQGALFMLVAPGSGGQNLDFMDQGWSATGTSDVNLTFFDTAGQYVPLDGTPAGGTYEATDDNQSASTFASAEAPSIDNGIPQVPGTIQYAPSYQANGKTLFNATGYTFEQAFNGAPANGDWALYANGNGEALSLSGGWCITLTPNTGTASTTSIASNNNPALNGPGQTVTFTATVTDTNGPVNSGTVTFLDYGATPAGTVSGNNAVTLNGSGQATFTTSSLSEGDHTITADFGGSSSDNPSSGTVIQRLDNATAVSGVSNSAAQFCNTGGVLTAHGQSGPFTPNPSNIFVANMPGKVSTVSLTLDNFSTESDSIYQVESMLAGPTGANLDFFSDTGDSNTVLSIGNYAFSDSGESLVPQSAFSPGTYEPTSYLTSANPSGDTYTASPSGFYPLPGSISYAATHGSSGFGSSFESTNPNGTWGLYFNQTEHGSAAGATNGWCLNFTNDNLPTVTVDASHTGSFYAGGSGGQITISVINNSTSATSTGDPSNGGNPMTVTDVLNSAFTPGTLPTGAPWNCSASGQTVTCTDDAAVAPGVNYPLLTIPVNAVASGNPTNEVSAGGAGVSSTNSNTDTITVAGTATHFSVSAPTSATAGSSFQITVTALDASNNTVTGYTGTVHFTTSDTGVQVSLPANAMLTGGAGNFYVTLVTVATGSQTVTATDTANSTITGSAIVPVNPGPAASLQIAGFPGTANAGASLSFTVTAYDLYGNQAAGYTGTLTFTSTDPAATLPAPSSLTAGTGNFSVTFNTPGTQTVTATDSVDSLAIQSSSVTVSIPNLVVNEIGDDGGAASNCSVQTTPGTTTNADTCYLRDALLQAAALGSANISFDSTVFLSTNSAAANTITLGSASTMTIPPNTTITGPTTGSGATLSTLVTVSGANTYGVFQVNSGVVAISGLNIANGSNINRAGAGGGINIAVGSTVNVSNSTFTGNSALASAGGAINNAGALTVSHCIFDGNSGSSGGAIFDSGTLTVSNSTFTDNNVGVYGGAIFDHIDVLTVDNSTFTGNSAEYGGAIFRDGNEPGGALTVNNSTFYGNSASFGGGIYTSSMWLNVSNSTFTGNSASDFGGGIASVAENSGSIANSIVSGNSSSNGADTYGGYIDNGGNVVGSSTINLASLGNYGGPTQTMLPLPGSSAICAGTSTNAAGLTTDQRGLPLPDPNCPSGSVDAGAVQTTYALSFSTEPSSTQYESDYILPSPVVALTESGVPATVPTSTVTMSDTTLPSHLSGTLSEALAAGSATFPKLSVSVLEGSDTLSATLSLNPSLSTPLNLVSSPSNAFSVNAPATTALTSPTPGSTLTGPSATFIWTAGSGATSYTLWLGSTGVGSNNIWGSGATTATSVTFGGLPTNGETVYARLYATVNGVSKHYDYTFTAATAAMLTSPTVGSTLLGTGATFKWTAPTGATSYSLWLGSTGVGSNNIWGSGTTTATSVSFNGLPINGETIYARLFTNFNGFTVHADFTYRAVAAAVLTSPTPNSTLASPSATFQWTAPTGATAYSLWLGSTGVGSNNLWGSGSTTATSVTFGGLPTNGETIYARLFSTVNGTQLHTDYTYTAASLAVLTSPAPNSTLPGPSTTFRWTAPTGATAYTLWLGSTGVGSNNLADSSSTTATSATFGGLPINGETIYVRLYTTLSGFKLHADFTYTAASAAVLTSPSPTSTLAGPSTTFQWTAPTGATAYTLWLGSSGVGSNNIWSSGSTTATSVTFGGLPTNGETIYARLFTTLGGVSVHTDTTYTAATAAVLTSPTPSSTFTGTSETFTWTAASNALQYSIWVGTSVGSNNLGYTQGGTTSTFFTLNNLPTNGETIHVRLYTNYAGGGLAHNDYTYTAYTAVTGTPVTHTIQISNDADDGYYNNDDGSGWHSDPQAGGADWVGSWSGTTEAWVTGYRFESTGINSGDTIQSAYLQLWSSDGFATSSACGGAPCASSNSTFRVYGVAQDDGPVFSNATGNTPLDVPYTTSYTDYTTTGPGDAHGSCQGQNNGQNTCTHTIDVTAIVNEITSRPGWTNTSSMRFVMLSTDITAPSVYAGFEDSSANASKAATLAVNPQTPTVVSSGAFGTSAQPTYPTTYETGPFVYQGASTLLLFLGDYYNFYGQAVDQPTVTDSCGNSWNILAGPTDWMGMIYDMRSTVYFVQSPASCPGGDTITVTADNQEPIFLHFLAIAGSDTTQAPVVSAITSPTPGTYTTSATSNSVTLANGGLLVSWIFGDSDSPTTFTPPTGFVTDPNSTPTYLTAVSEGVSSAGSYQSQFAISPSDGWQVVTIGFSAPTP
jgi:subtilisin-like proprotein convertase family protein